MLETAANRAFSGDCHLNSGREQMRFFERTKIHIEVERTDVPSRPRKWRNSNAIGALLLDGTEDEYAVKNGLYDSEK